MKRTHVQYTINLDNTYQNTLELVHENIKLFNQDIFRFINKQFGVSNKYDFIVCHNLFMYQIKYVIFMRVSSKRL